MKRELGYYWVEYDTTDNWLIFWFNGGYWSCCAMGKIELNDEKILSIDERKLHQQLTKFKTLKSNKIKPIFRWFDFWVGLFLDTKKKTLYIFPLSMLGIMIQFKQNKKQNP